MKLTVAGKRRRTVKGGKKAMKKRAAREELKVQRIEKFFGNKEVKDYSRIVEIRENSAMGGEVGITTHNIDIVTQLKEELLFDKNGVITPYGIAIQKKILRLTDSNVENEEYVRTIKEIDTVSSIEKNNKIKTTVLDVNKNSLKQFGAGLLKTSCFNNISSWNNFIADYDAVGRFFQETCIDGKKTAIKQSSIIKKSAALASKKITLDGNYNSFRNGVIYNDLKCLNETFKFDLGEVVNKYQKGDIDESISYDYHLDSKISAINSVEEVINTDFVEEVQCVEDEKIVIGGELEKEYKAFINILEEYSGIEKARLYKLFDRSLYKIASLIEAICDINSIENSIRIIAIDAIASEIIDAINKINSVSKKENGIEEDMVFVGGEDNIETGSIDLSIKRLIVVSFMALETKFYARGGKDALTAFMYNNFFKTQVGKTCIFGEKGNENNNPFFVSRASKEVSEKSYDYSLVRIHKIFSGFTALIFNAELDLNDPSWKELGVIDGKLPKFGTHGYKIAVLDAIRDENRKKVALSSIIENADFSDSKLAEFRDEIMSTYKQTVIRQGYDVTGLVGKKLVRNPEIKVQFDKNKVPNASHYGLYNNKKYVGTTGFYSVEGTVTAVFKNVLILQ